MKKLTMICMSALLMLAVSCKKDKKTEIENAGSGFRATVESHEGAGKTHLEDLAVKWDSGDAILVKSRTCPTPKRFTTTGTDASANFDAAESLPTNFYAPDYTAYYPGFETNPAGVYFSDDQLTLPSTQTYVPDEATFASGANPMAALSSSTTLPFKNICGVLKLQLYSTTACQVRSISITSNTGEMLWGTGTVGFDAADDNDNPTLGTLNDGGSTLTLDMGEGGKAMSTSDSAPTAYYFVVPAGTLGTSFTVKVTETNGNVWSKTANAHQNLIARSQITVLPKQAVATQMPVVPITVTLTAGCAGSVYNLGGSVTVPDGEHACEFGFVYSATNAEPTVADTKVVAGTATFSGTKTFSADIIGLAAGTTYHVRAYAMIEGAAYSTAQDIEGGTTPLPLPSSWTDGKNPHPFTVASGKQVYFSQGNLQYLAKGGTGGDASATAPSGENVGGTWRFAEHQFDFIGADNANAAQNYGGWIDLFGWGTSGYNHNDKSYQPWSTSTNYRDYFAYGAYNNSLEGGTSPHTGKADWGKANAISNGGSNSWRTLTKDEWVYLINTRKDASNKLLYGEGKVGDCTPGLIILPDDWSCPSEVTDVVRGKSKWSNVYTYSQWAQLEAAGAVFLPAAGWRNFGTISFVGQDGRYWSSSSCFDASCAGNLFFSSNTVYPEGENDRYDGRSVRLVSDDPPVGR